MLSGLSHHALGRWYTCYKEPHLGLAARNGSGEITDHAWIEVVAPLDRNYADAHVEGLLVGSGEEYLSVDALVPGGFRRLSDHLRYGPPLEVDLICLRQGVSSLHILRDAVDPKGLAHLPAVPVQQSFGDQVNGDIRNINTDPTLSIGQGVADPGPDERADPEPLVPRRNR